MPATGCSPWTTSATLAVCAPAAVAIVSAGYGLVAEDRLLASYEATFNEMGRREALAWSRHLGIARDVRAAATGFPLVEFLLGARYLDALEPPVIPQAGQRFIFLAGSGTEGAVGGPGVTVAGAGREEAATYGSPAIAVKGRMFELFARGFAQEAQAGAEETGAEGETEAEALWDRLIADDSPATFMHAVRIGNELRERVHGKRVFEQAPEEHVWAGPGRFAERAFVRFVFPTTTPDIDRP